MPTDPVTRREREAMELATWIAEKARRHALRHNEDAPEMLSVLAAAYGVGLRVCFAEQPEEVKRGAVDVAVMTLRNGAEKLLNLTPRN